MKMTPELEKAQKNMTPGIISAEGFLGDDTRNLADILQEDARLLNKLGLDPVLLAARLRFFLQEAQRGLGEAVTVEGTWLARSDEARGRLPCPWEDCVRRKIYISVQRIDDGSSFTYTDLSIHLLEAHGFLQGRSAPFRLDPALVKKVLNL